MDHTKMIASGEPRMKESHETLRCASKSLELCAVTAARYRHVWIISIKVVLPPRSGINLGTLPAGEFGGPRFYGSHRRESNCPFEFIRHSIHGQKLSNSHESRNSVRLFFSW